MDRRKTGGIIRPVQILEHGQYRTCQSDRLQRLADLAQHALTCVSRHLTPRHLRCAPCVSAGNRTGHAGACAAKVRTTESASEHRDNRLSASSIGCKLPCRYNPRRIVRAYLKHPLRGVGRAASTALGRQSVVYGGCAGATGRTRLDLTSLDLTRARGWQLRFALAWSSVFRCHAIFAS
jgi:hypothetical protein